MMDYNNYYPAQTGQPPPPPPTTMVNNNNQHDCTIMPGQMTPTGLMHSSPAPSTPQSMRHTPGPPPMQQQHHMGPNQHPMTPQQQSSPHPNYHQLPPHPPISLSASPHPSSTPHSQAQPPPRPSTGPSPLHHHQSPIHMNGPSPKNVPVQSRPPSNQLPPPHGGHSFPGSPMPPHAGGPHYGQPPPPPQPQMNHHPHHHHPHHLPPPPPPQQSINHGGPPMMQGAPGMPVGPPPPPPPHPPSGYMPPHPGVHHANQERSSPFYQHIPQSEFRIIELNKRLQSRPRTRGPSSPLPLIGSSDESNWWERFACDFFDDESSLSIRIPGEDKPIEYTIGRPLIPRFFKSYFDGGVTDLSIKLRNIRETQHHSSLVALDCDQADIVTKNFFKHPVSNTLMYVVVHTEGHLSLEFVGNSFDNLVIKSWRFYANQCHEYIDRSMTTTGLSSAYLVEPVTRFGLTKSTVAYLKMCMIMEPMQDLMIHHRQTKLEPKQCLKHLLYDRYKVKIEENRAQPNKRRKRKAPAATGGGAATNKKSKANVNVMNGGNAIGGMNAGLLPGNDVCMGIPNMPLASQDVLVVGEPSMLGADFGDENERRITRLENNQYDSSIDQNQSQQSNITTSDSNEINQNQNRIASSNIMNQNLNQQNDLPNHISQGASNHESGANGGRQSHLGYQNQSINHNNGGMNDHGSSSSSSSNEMNENNLIASGNNNNNNGNSNCIQNNNNPSLLNAGDTTNHQMNSYSMNGEAIHISIHEMDAQPKQSMQPPNQQLNPKAESETR
uniref:LIM domain-binding protein 2 n=1 Tax=Aceria tosichella TaxID=561515 RepID=A0A6G1SJW6_9ACAR